MKSQDAFIVYLVFVLFMMIASCGNPPHNALRRSKDVLDLCDVSCDHNVHDLGPAGAGRLEETLKEIDLMSQEISTESVEILVR
jgi:hypothetical protein